MKTWANEQNGQFSKEDLQITNKDKKKCSTSNTYIPIFSAAVFTVAKL
jgi:hypothetical protein